MRGVITDSLIPSMDPVDNDLFTKIVIWGTRSSTICLYTEAGIGSAGEVLIFIFLMMPAISSVVDKRNSESSVIVWECTLVESKDIDWEGEVVLAAMLERILVTFF